MLYELSTCYPAQRQERKRKYKTSRSFAAYREKGGAIEESFVVYQLLSYSKLLVSDTDITTKFAVQSLAMHHEGISVDSPSLLAL